MSKPLLCHFGVNARKQQLGCMRMAQIMEAYAGKAVHPINKAAELMRDAVWQNRRAVIMGIDQSIAIKSDSNL